MPADIGTQPFPNAIRNLANLRGYQPHSLGLTIARMLAAARMCPKEKDGVPGFLDQSRELTKADWHALVQLLAKQWRSRGGRSDNPFERPGEPSFDEPGALEQLRRLVLAYLERDGTKTSVPSWLLTSVVELARPRTLFAGGIDPEVQDLVTETIGVTPRKRVFCAYDGAIEIALRLAAEGADVTLDVDLQEMAALCSCLAIGADLRLHVRQGNPLALAAADMGASLLVHDTYDASFVAPPFNVRYPIKDADTLGTNLPPPPSSEAAGVMLALARSRDLAVCLVAPSFLFQTSKAEQAFKERAINDHGLDAVVGLPRGSFANTAVAAALIVFRPKASSQQRGARQRDVCMIDARGERNGPGPFPGSSEQLAALISSRKPSALSASVAVDELAANDFNLSVERYVLDPDVLRLRELTENAPTVSLDDIAELYRPQAIPSAKGTATTQPVELGEIGVADIDEVGLVRRAGKHVQLQPDMVRQAQKARLAAGDVLLVIKGSIGKVGFIREVPDDATWLASQSFAILRLRPHAPLSDPRVLFRFLSSPLGQANLQSLRVGSAVPGLQMADVRRLPIILPGVSEQRAIGREVEELFALQDQIEELRAKAVAKQAEVWPETPRAKAPDRIEGASSARPKPAAPRRKSAS